MDKTYAIALGLATGAGLATGVGAILPFFKVAATRKFLAISLSFAAGVMGYVSFMEMLPVSVEAFEGGQGASRDYAYIWGPLCFFMGILLTALLDVIVHRMEPGGSSAHSHQPHDEFSNIEAGSVQKEPQPTEPQQTIVGVHSDTFDNKDPTEGISFWRNPIEFIKTDWRGTLSESDNLNRQRLTRAGIISTLAVGLHNFPEGMATFLSYTADPTVGATVAVAIAIHNIPEGICVAMPIYHATGSRLRGFFWGFMSGVSEVIGALVGLAIVSIVTDTSLLYGIMFGSVGGMMVFISFKELLPMAHRYDPAGNASSLAFFSGLFVMAFSLVLFEV